MERKILGERYLVREELNEKRDKLRRNAMRRAWKFEKKLEEEGGGSSLTREYWREIKEREREGREVGSI